METALWGGLINLGGGFVLAAVILYLHRDSLKAFRSELASERVAFRDEMAKERESTDTLMERTAIYQENSDRRHFENLNRLDLILEHVRLHNPHVADLIAKRAAEEIAKKKNGSEKQP